SKEVSRMRNCLRNLDDRFKHTQSDKGSGRPRDAGRTIRSRFSPRWKGKCMPAREAILEGRVLRRLHVGPIDFALRPGECVSIGGKSGAGKSVLLRMVADLDPQEGDTFLDGAASSDMPAPKWRRKVNYVAAESGWWEEGVDGHVWSVACGLTLTSWW